MTENHDCPYCHLDDAGREPAGGWIHRDAHWLVNQGPSETTMAGGLKITSRRHFTDFAEMTGPEAASFGPLLTRFDAAMRDATGAERVHLVSTRDRVQHFHAWLYPRQASCPLRGTEFLNAPQYCDPAEAGDAASAIRSHLAPMTPDLETEPATVGPRPPIGSTYRVRAEVPLGRPGRSGRVRRHHCARHRHAPHRDTRRARSRLAGGPG